MKNLENEQAYKDALNTMAIELAKSQAAYDVLLATFNEACLTYPHLDACDLRLVMQHMLLEKKEGQRVLIPADGGVNVH